MDYDFDYEPSEKELGDLIERWETAWEEFLEERAADEQPYKYPLPKKLIDPIDRGSNPREQRYIDSHWSFRFTLTETDIQFLIQIGATWEDTEARAQIEKLDWYKWMGSMWFQGLIRQQGTPEEQARLKQMREEDHRETQRQFEFEKERMALAKRISKHAPPTGWKQ
jgi:hypothetical protein